MRVTLLAVTGLLTLASAVVAQDGATLLVAADGSARYDTITAAIEAAAPGDTILIAPGTYVENLDVDKPITLRGDGPREDIVIVPDPRTASRREVPDDDPVVTHIFVDRVDATIESLSLGDSERIQAGLMLTGGNPVVRDVISPRVTGVNGDIDALLEGSELGRIIIMGSDARMTVRNNTVNEGMIVGMGATGLVQDNLILNLPIDILEDSSLEVRGNTIRPEEGAPGIWVSWANASATIVDNRIEGAWQGVMVEHGSSARIEGNTITEPQIGIQVVETGALIRDNTITDASEFGIVISGNGTTAEGNSISGGRVGMVAAMPNGYPPNAPRFDETSRIIANTITGASHFGLVVDDAAPVVSGNTICAEREPLKLEGEASPNLGTNEICAVDG